MKFLNIFLSLSLLLTVSACTLKKEEPKTTDTKPTSEEIQKHVLNKGIRFGAPTETEDPLVLTARSLQPAIDKWLKEGIANGTLNEWGDMVGTEAPTAQQLMDSKTKKTNTKYEWIVKRHADLLAGWAKQIQNGEVK